MPIALHLVAIQKIPFFSWIRIIAYSSLEASLHSHLQFYLYSIAYPFNQNIVGADTIQGSLPAAVLCRHVWY